MRNQHYKNKQSEFAPIRVQNFAIICVFSFLLASPALSYLLQTSMTDLPAFVTNEDYSKLSGGTTPTDLNAHFNLDGFLGEDMQSSLESKIEDYIPFRANIVFGFAISQQNAIKLSNCLFNWACYPTFYGSDMAYLVDYDAVRIIPPPHCTSTAIKNGTRSYFTEMTAVAERYPSKTFVVYAVDALEVSQTNPVSRLMSSNIASLDDFIDTANDAISAENLVLLHDEYASTEDYYEHFFKTDHHWNIKGAFNAYAKIAYSLNMDIDSELMSNLEYLHDLRVLGSAARSARMYLTETVFDSPMVIEGLKSLSDEGAYNPIAWKDNWIYWDQDTIIDFYSARYTHTIGSDAVIRGNESKSILLLSDSFGESLRFLLAHSSRQIVNREDISRSHLSENIDSLIQRYDPDSIVVVAHPLNLSQFVSNNPRYLSSAQGA